MDELDHEVTESSTANIFSLVDKVIMFLCGLHRSLQDTKGYCKVAMQILEDNNVDVGEEVLHRMMNWRSLMKLLFVLQCVVCWLYLLSTLIVCIFCDSFLYFVIYKNYLINM